MAELPATSRRTMFKLGALSVAGLTLASCINSYTTPALANDLPTATMYRGTTKSGLKFTQIKVYSKGKRGVIGKYIVGHPDGVAKPGPRVPCGFRKPVEIAQMSGAQIVLNDSNTNGGYLLGMHIQNGVLLKGFDYAADGSLPYSTRASEGIGFTASGEVHLFNAWEGDTPESLLAAGVVSTHGFGPVMVRDGVALDVENTPRWKEYGRGPSARQFLGVDKHGNVMVLSTYGISGKIGMGVNEAARFAAERGFHHAIMLDGGGSVQTVVNGEFVHPSSDAPGYRLLPSATIIRANVVETSVGESLVAGNYPVFGGIGAYYLANGGSAVFGNAVSHEISVPGGVYQSFVSGQKMTRIYWSPETGARAVNIRGGIGSYYVYHQGPARLGFPITEEHVDKFGATQHFLKGDAQTILAWAPYTRVVAEINAKGGIHWKWQLMGGAQSVGMPVTNEIRGKYGVHQVFRSQSGAETVFVWGSASGATYAVNHKGALYHEVRRRGGFDAVGIPVHDERRESDGRYHLRFDRGLHLTWSVWEGVRAGR